MKILRNLFLFLFLFSNANASDQIRTADKIVIVSKEFDKYFFHQKKLNFNKLYKYQKELYKYSMIDEYLNVAHKVVSKSIEIYGLDSIEVQYAYLDLALAYLMKGNKETADILYSFVFESRENTIYEKNIEISLMLMNLKTIFLLFSNDLDKSYSYAKKTYNIIQDKFKKNKNLYIESSINIATISNLVGDYNQTLKIIKKILKNLQISQNYLSLDQLCEFQILASKAYFGLGERQTSLSTMQDLTYSLEKKNIIAPITVKVFAEYASLLAKNNIFNLASRYAGKSLKYQKKLKIKDTITSCLNWYIMAIFQERLKYYKKSTEAYQSALNIAECCIPLDFMKNDIKKTILNSYKKMKNIMYQREK